jgi:2,5-furandicarboxylate decarboxylase 1
MPKDLRGHLKDVERSLPSEIVTIDREMDPAFEISAILQQLDEQHKYPLCLFTNVRDMKGRPGHKVVSNLMASRRRLALAMGMDPENSQMGLSLEIEKRAAHPVKPIVVARDEAPVMEIVRRGEEQDLRDFPVIRQHEMDGGHYFTMGFVNRDPDRPLYNASHQRLMVRGPSETGMCMAPFHTWRIYKENAQRGRVTPSVAVQGHHPLFFLACAMRVPYDVDEYDVVGSLMQEPLRVTPSQTWGDELLVPADAEICIEGEILPNELKPEGPFGEWTGYYSGQRQGEVFRVTAITHRKDPILVNVFAGHRDHTPPIGWESEVFRRVKGAVAGVRSVCIAPSGNGMHCYISIDKTSDGEPRLAAMAAGSMGFFKLIIVVDSDVDPFNEQEVLWALAVRFQAHRDLDIVRGVLGSMVDPSMDQPRTHSLLILDATEPKDRPLPQRSRVPLEVMERVKLQDYVAPEALERLR